MISEFLECSAAVHATRASGPCLSGWRDPQKRLVTGPSALLGADYTETPGPHDAVPGQFLLDLTGPSASAGASPATASAAALGLRLFGRVSAVFDGDPGLGSRWFGPGFLASPSLAGTSRSLALGPGFNPPGSCLSFP